MYTQNESILICIKYAKKLNEGWSRHDFDIREKKELTDAIYCLETGEFKSVQAEEIKEDKKK